MRCPTAADAFTTVTSSPAAPSQPPPPPQHTHLAAPRALPAAGCCCSRPPVGPAAHWQQQLNHHRHARAGCWRQQRLHALRLLLAAAWEPCGGGQCGRQSLRRVAVPPCHECCRSPSVALLEC
jgi:hypothetical protein